jgi:hypothetical protein
MIGNGELDDQLYPLDITRFVTGTGAYVPAVYFGDQASPEFELVNDHLLRVVVPPGTDYGAVDVVITGNAPQRIVNGYEYVAEICVR